MNKKIIDGNNIIVLSEVQILLIPPQPELLPPKLRFFIYPLINPIYKIDIRF